MHLLVLDFKRKGKRKDGHCRKEGSRCPSVLLLHVPKDQKKKKKKKNAARPCKGGSLVLCPAHLHMSLLRKEKRGALSLKLANSAT
jgi:hypothetical protein